ncbi:MAG: hypothetical protein Ta2D_10060 [Rickettsiales bacterium]|nr:MAG: hypothetical protein Ta2D_10060 [Rickettsiales bacterium]
MSYPIYTNFKKNCSDKLLFQKEYANNGIPKRDVEYSVSDQKQYLEKLLDICADNSIVKPAPNNNNGYYTFTDTHGDDISLLGSLMNIGAIEIPNPTTYSYIDAQTGNKLTQQQYDNLSLQDKQSNSRFLVYPNIKLNKHFNGHVIFQGDICDKGGNGFLSLAILKDVMEQEGNVKNIAPEKRKITLIAGNHEVSDIDLVSPSSHQFPMNKMLSELQQDGRMVAGVVVGNGKDAVLFSHSPFHDTEIYQTFELVRFMRDGINNTLYFSSADHNRRNELLQYRNSFLNKMEAIERGLSDKISNFYTSYLQRHGGRIGADFFAELQTQFPMDKLAKVRNVMGDTFLNLRKFDRNGNQRICVDGFLDQYKDLSNKKLTGLNGGNSIFNNNTRLNNAITPINNVYGHKKLFNKPGAKINKFGNVNIVNDDISRYADGLNNNRGNTSSLIHNLSFEVDANGNISNIANPVQTYIRIPRNNDHSFNIIAQSRPVAQPAQVRHHHHHHRHHYAPNPPVQQYMPVAQPHNPPAPQPQVPPLQPQFFPPQYFYQFQVMYQQFAEQQQRLRRHQNQNRHRNRHQNQIRGRQNANQGMGFI